MSQNLQELLAQAQADVEETGIDMNEAVKGGGGRLLPVGYAFGRLVEYVELGNQPQEFGGKQKDPCMEVSLGFALWGQGYQNEDGTPYIIRPYSFALSRNEKARAFKLFRALNWMGDKKSFGQLLGSAFLVKINHVPKSKTDATIVSRVDLDGFLPPLDPVTKQPYPIPEADPALYRLFLWNRPTKQAWDSLFIEGTYDAKDGKPAQSKNRVQETILGAVDFQGSALQQLLMGAGITTLPQAPAAVPATPAVVAAAPLASVPPVVAPVAAPAPLSAPAVAVTPPASTVAALPAVAPTISPAPIVPAAIPVNPVLPA